MTPLASALLDAFVAGLHPRWRDAPADEMLATLLDGGIEAAEQEHAKNAPRTPNRNEFARYLAERLPEDTDPATGVRACHIAELYLAFSCAHGDSGAIARLEARYREDLDSGVKRLRQHPLQPDELRQLMRQRLFVVDGRSCAISRYSGRGPLGAWLQIFAVRTALNATRAKQRMVHGFDDDAFVVPETLGDPELDHLKEIYRDVFKRSFRAAVQGLSARQRTLLRHSTVHELSARALAKMYNTHHSTTARWLTEARATLVRAIRTDLEKNLRVSDDELASILQMIRSQLDVSLVRVLAP